MRHSSHTSFISRRTVLIILVFSALPLTSLSCLTPADIREHQIETVEAMNRDADLLFNCLNQVAIERDILTLNVDPERRYIRSDWIDEDSIDGVTTQRRYYLSVIYHPAGLALRVNIVRRTPSDEADTVSDEFEELERTETVASEEQEIIDRAYSCWLSAR